MFQRTRHGEFTLLNLPLHIWVGVFPLMLFILLLKAPKGGLVLYILETVPLILCVLWAPLVDTVIFASNHGNR
jgi:hypothetical protein